MAYQAEISRVNPTCFIFVIDQSGSMDERIGGTTKTKAEFVADVLNKTIVQLIIRCTRQEGVRDFFDVGVIAYGGSGVGNGFRGALASGALHPISAIEQNVLRVEERKKKVDDGAGGLVEQTTKFPIWFEAVNSGGTPMCEALRVAATSLVHWCDTHPGAYPPTIIHVTDGQSSDGDPSEIAEQLKLISTQDGQCLLFNLHVSTDEGSAILFPSSPGGLPDQYSKMLFNMSSFVPEHLLAAAREKGYAVDAESRFFGYKADVAAIVDFFDIGTRAANLR